MRSAKIGTQSDSKGDLTLQKHIQDVEQYSYWLLPSFVSDRFVIVSGERWDHLEIYWSGQDGMSEL